MPAVSLLMATVVTLSVAQQALPLELELHDSPAQARDLVGQMVAQYIAEGHAIWPVRGLEQPKDRLRLSVEQDTLTLYSAHQDGQDRLMILSLEPRPTLLFEAHQWMRDLSRQLPKHSPPPTPTLYLRIGAQLPPQLSPLILAAYARGYVVAPLSSATPMADAPPSATICFSDDGQQLAAQAHAAPSCTPQPNAQAHDADALISIVDALILAQRITAQAKLTQQHISQRPNPAPKPAPKPQVKAPWRLELGFAGSAWGRSALSDPAPGLSLSFSLGQRRGLRARLSASAFKPTQASARLSTQDNVATLSLEHRWWPITQHLGLSAGLGAGLYLHRYTIDQRDAQRLTPQLNLPLSAHAPLLGPLFAELTLEPALNFKAITHIDGPETLWSASHLRLGARACLGFVW